MGFRNLASTISLRREDGVEVLDLIEFEGRVERGEIGPASEVCFPPLTGDAFARAGELEAFRELFEPRALYFRRAFHLGRFPVLTSLLSLALLGIFLLQRRAGPVDTALLIQHGAKASALISDLGQLWRLWTANFIHRDWAHLGFNLFVLFHFGAAVENAYRARDFLWVVAASALGAMVLSHWMIGGVSAGASGVAFGMLGSTVVFGFKYRRLLPQRHRRVLGAGVLPTVAVFLYMGWASRGIDNWAHLGGLSAGALATVALEPRLLAAASDPRRLLVGRVLPLGSMALLFLVGEPLLSAWLPRMVEVRDESLRLELRMPASWKGRGVHGFDNDMPIPARASLIMGAVPAREGFTLEDAAARWVTQKLEAEERRGRVRDARLLPLERVRIDGRDAVLQRVHLLVDGTPTMLFAHLFQSEALSYWIVTARPESLPGYDAVFERILSSIRTLP